LRQSMGRALRFVAVPLEVIGEAVASNTRLGLFGWGEENA